MELDRMGCVTNGDSRRSVAVAERLGMTPIGETRVPRDDPTRTVAALLLHITRGDWLTVRNNRSEHP
jgi:RimJ/RimL family protein N-acetyltransferase